MKSSRVIGFKNIVRFDMLSLWHIKIGETDRIKFRFQDIDIAIQVFLNCVFIIILYNFEETNIALRI